MLEGLGRVNRFEGVRLAHQLAERLVPLAVVFQYREPCAAGPRRLRTSQGTSVSPSRRRSTADGGLRGPQSPPGPANDQGYQHAVDAYALQEVGGLSPRITVNG